MKEGKKKAADEEAGVVPTAPADQDKDADGKEVPVPPEPKTSYFELWRYADGFDRFLVAVALVGCSGSGIILPLFTVVFGGLVDSFNVGVDVQAKVTEQSVKFIYLAGGGGIAAYLQNLCWAKVSDRITNKIRRKYLAALLRTEIGFFDQASSGELVSRISSDVTLISLATGTKMGVFLQFMVTFVAGLIVGLVKGWKLTLVILACIPLLALTAGLMVSSIMKLSARESKAYSAAGGIAQELFSQIRTVAAFTGEQRGLDSYLKALGESISLGIRAKIITGIGLGSTLLVMFGMYGLALWYGSTLILSDGYTGGDVINVFFAVLMAGFSIGQAMPNTEAFSRGQAAGYKIFSHIDRKPEIDSSDPGGLKPAKVAGVIELRDVDFVYPNRPNVQIFNGFNLTIDAGQFVALVGESGSGKSTVVSLIERLYDPQAGMVLLDGIDIRQLNLRWLRQQIGLVSQEPALFATSIKENMMYGKEGATDAEIDAAARSANAYNFVTALPDGFDTQVGERGLQLSGGQKQRIAIARAVLRNPKILLLDEATSALDNESERIVQEALDRLMKGRTTVVVAHRLSTIRNADSIAVVQKGVIVERGHYDDLLKQGGVFTGLAQLQGHAAADAASAGASNRGESVGPGGVSARVVQVALDGPGSSKPANPDEILAHDMPHGLTKPGATDKTAGKNAAELRADKKKDAATVASTAPKVAISRLAALNLPELPFALVGSLAAAINGSIFPIFAIIFGSLLEVFFLKDENKLKEEARFWALMFFTLGWAALIVNATQSTCSGYIGQRLTHRIRKLALQAALRQDVGFYDDERNTSGTLCARLETDAALIKNLVGDGLLLAVQNLCTLFSALAISLAYGWQLALIIVSTFPLTLVGGYFQIRAHAGLTGDTREMYEAATQVAMDAVTNARTVSAFTADDRVMGLFETYLKVPIQNSGKAAQMGGVSYGLSQFLQLAPYSLAFWVGGKLVQEGNMTFKGIMVVFFAITMGAMGISNSFATITDAGNAQQAAASVFELVDRKTPIDSSDEGGQKPAKVTGDIELRDVDFVYPNRPNVQIFKGFSLMVPAGKVVALVGESGSGKSTVVGLVERFYDPLKGTVLLDGIDIRQLNLRWLRQQIGLVSQEPALFATSIKDNILYGKSDASDAEVEAATRAANAHSFISRLPDGLNTQVGERGLQMSGGQKQRIAIARAVLKDPRILLLDEATSALDSESERIVQEALDRLMKGRTTVVVAHRLSTIRNADSIAVVQKGVIIEQGNHDELIAKGGAYNALMSVRQGEGDKSSKGETSTVIEEESME